MGMKIGKACILLLVVAGLCDPPDLSSCGPFLPSALFTFAHRPAEAEEFARGRLGVLQPAYVRFYLVVAYRYLSGAGLNDAERAALLNPPSSGAGGPWDAAMPPAVDEWLAARAKVTGGGPKPQIREFRQISASNYFSYYLNCGGDAFRSATRTLGERIGKYGAASAEVKAWTGAQDQVFANCSGGAVIPAALESGDPLARSDRAYQIAAANFYAGQFAAAESMFRQIAADRTSPWSAMAPYLVARTLIREGTVGVAGKGVDKERLAAAEAQLEKVLGNPAEKDLHASAARLLGFVRTRLYPERRMHELAQALAAKDSPATIEQDLTDYRMLYDHFEEGQYGGMAALPVGDDLTDWLRTFQAGDKAAADHAVEKWRATQGLPWLVASISSADTGSASMAELISAAGKVQRDSPAYASVQFHAIRLLIQAKRDDEARSKLTPVLADAALPPSAANLFRAEQTKIARDWNEFLKYAPRTPAGVDYGVGEGNFSADGEDVPKGVDARGPAFDADSVKILNEQAPLELLLNAARSDALSEPLRREVAVAAWTRAVLIRDEGAAGDAATVLESLVPELKQPLEAYVKADAEARQFAAVWLMLRSPGMKPYVRTGYGRLTPLAKTDSLRDNWWCSALPKPETAEFDGQSLLLGEALHVLYQSGAPQAHFLSPEQQARASEEVAKLAQVAAAPNYLAEQTLAWVQAHPDDPRAPEALHLTVHATRYGCANPATGRYSKQAFQLLHRRYPNSEWAQKTKYWYGTER